MAAANTEFKALTAQAIPSPGKARTQVLGVRGSDFDGGSQIESQTKHISRVTAVLLHMTMHVRVRTYTIRTIESLVFDIRSLDRLRPEMLGGKGVKGPGLLQQLPQTLRLVSMVIDATECMALGVVQKGRDYSDQVAGVCS